MHSSLASVPAQVVSGVLAGEVAGAIVRANGGGETAQRIARTTTHSTVSAGVGWLVNALLVDPIAAGTVTPATATGGAVAHETAREVALGMLSQLIGKPST